MLIILVNENSLMDIHFGTQYLDYYSLLTNQTILRSSLIE